MTHDSSWELAAAALTGGLIVGVTLLTFHVTADQDPTTDGIPRVITYHGALDQDGAPVHAVDDDARWMRFTITDGNQPGSPIVYTQTLQVSVFFGQFTVSLGPQDDNNVPIERIIGNADDLFVRTTLLNEHNPEDPASTAGDDVALNNPQPLSLSPHAVWANRATDFNVAGTLDANSATVGARIS